MNDPAARRRKITLADVAAGCGVSRATVSLVLRRSPLVNAATRARVEAEFQRLGYVYNRSAASLRSRRSSSVALVINDLSNPFFAEFAAGVDEALAAAGYVTLLGSTGESAERQQAVLASLMEHDPAGVILSPAEGSDARRVCQAVGAHTPVLVFNRELAASGWDHLGLDNRDGARQATEHLLALGHTRIAFFGGHAGSSSCRQRREGYAAALAAAGLAVQPQWLVETAPTRLEAAGQAGALFARDPAPTAAVCYNDAVALGLMLGLLARGRRPGVDFAVTGFDDIPEAALSVPPLTTLAADPRARGRQAAALVLARLGQREAIAVQTIVPVQLRVRASSCAPGRP
ncbi:LacI family DNA-binding transcriptional regulator [Tahibacter harae]|uniref:LacI family DNA-binding transcriptional regulator n=1 Tax=Tahibacter harae TaxID=2963937 RepID=UPI0031BA6754